MFSAKVLWPLFPLLLLVVVVCLTWALVHVWRGGAAAPLKWIQTGAFSAYLLAAVAAVASEGGRASVNLHRPFSALAQLCLVAGLVIAWRGKDRRVVRLNALAWAAILADTALHFLLRR